MSVFPWRDQVPRVSVLVGTATQLDKWFTEHSRPAAWPCLCPLRAHSPGLIPAGAAWAHRGCPLDQATQSSYIVLHSLFHPMLQSLSPGAKNALTTLSGLSSAVPDLISNVLVPEFPILFPQYETFTKTL